MDRKLGTLAIVAAFTMAACESGRTAQPAEVASAVAPEPAAVAEQPAPQPMRGPFGLAQGMTPAEVSRLVGKGPYSTHRSLQLFHTAPVPHPDFSTYGVMFSSTSGLCRVFGSSDGIKTNRFGTAITEKFTELEAALTKKYGTPSSAYDFLRPGSLWDQPEDWMMGLLEQDRTLATFWGKEGEPVVPTVESIHLEARATASDEAEIQLSYDFDNVDECIAETKTQDAAGL